MARRSILSQLFRQSAGYVTVFQLFCVEVFPKTLFPGNSSESVSFRQFRYLAAFACFYMSGKFSPRRLFYLCFHCLAFKGNKLLDLDPRRQGWQWCYISLISQPCFYCFDPLVTGGTIYSNGFFVQSLLADRYFHLRKLRLVSLDSVNSAERGI